MPMLETILHRLSQSQFSFILSYILSFDRKYQGFERKKITFIAARPCSGRTWLMCNCACLIAEHNHSVLFFSQNITQIAQRLSKLSNELPKIRIEEMLVFNSKVFRALCQQYKPDIVFIDVHLLGNIINKNILRRIKQIAQEQNLAVVMTGTLNRTIDLRTCKFPKTTDFYGINEQTGVLEIADKILTLYNASLYIPDFLCEDVRKLTIYPIKAPILTPLDLELKPTGEIIHYHPKEITLN